MSKELVRDSAGQIYRKGCRNTEGRTQPLVDEDIESFQGTSATEFAQYWTDYYNSTNLSDYTTAEEWFPFLKEELNPCTGIK